MTPEEQGEAQYECKLPDCCQAEPCKKIRLAEAYTKAFNAGYARAVSEKTVFATQAHVECMNECNACKAALARVEAAARLVSIEAEWPDDPDDKHTSAVISRESLDALDAALKGTP